MSRTNNTKLPGTCAPGKRSVAPSQHVETGCECNNLESSSYLKSAHVARREPFAAARFLIIAPEAAGSGLRTADEVAVCFEIGIRGPSAVHGEQPRDVDLMAATAEGGREVGVVYPASVSEFTVPTPTNATSTAHALKVGYRHIDTAQFYGNEKEVGDLGDVLRSSGLARSDVFMTTKILSPAGSSEATYEKLVASVEKIGGKDGYVDLFLIHSSKSGSAGRKELWQALYRLLEEQIGLSAHVIERWHTMHQKHTTEGIRWWSPTQLLTSRRVA
ncbi:hypothetical protein BP01DRAFT_383064 [Aspergillus saccharolyticus JOP 1030-1]|uniref:D-xylose reductase [NAD(P)H] n=1 Tax=Aspergillus saccharolyticus JOP 1030-1 TaxID=1450539 RepID=A0A318ZBJ1_9EURO|nr:hypothetical protein BP01DRAFT_383064 [Aspergillus saccharolyticus JOP 1030-1]PYH44831.1 hypothetical protein BP01DRAFT_383064 [Aspergillus saccharolyticus JOP 1030-1]